MDRSLRLKRLVVGKPIASSEEQHQRLGEPTALAVFASDAISSTAYATEEILLVLVRGGRRTRPLQVPGPDRDRRGRPAGDRRHQLPPDDLRLPRRRRRLRREPREPRRNAALVAGASLLVDYTLTVAVSIVLGRARHRARPFHGSATATASRSCLGFVVLHDARQPPGREGVGTLFAVPTYAYVVLPRRC